MKTKKLINALLESEMVPEESLNEENYLKKYYNKLDTMTDEELYKAWKEVKDAPDEDITYDEFGTPLEYNPTLASDALFSIEGELAHRGFMDEESNKTEKWTQTFGESEDPIKDDVKRDLNIETGSDEEEILNSLYEPTEDGSDDIDIDKFERFLEYIRNHPNNKLNFIQWSELNESSTDISKYKINYEDDLIIIKKNGKTIEKGIVDDLKDNWNDFNDFKFDETKKIYTCTHNGDTYTIEKVITESSSPKREEIAKIKKEIKEVKAELKYCDKRDEVCAAFGGDAQRYELEEKLRKLEDKLESLNEADTKDTLNNKSSKEEPISSVKSINESDLVDPVLYAESIISKNLEPETEFDKLCLEYKNTFEQMTEYNTNAKHIYQGFDIGNAEKKLSPEQYKEFKSYKDKYESERAKLREISNKIDEIPDEDIGTNAMNYYKNKSKGRRKINLWNDPQQAFNESQSMISRLKLITSSKEAGNEN